MNKEQFDDFLEEVSSLLPSQGPLEVFIHHNTLHAFESREFYQAIEEASLVYNAKPYLPETEYHDLIKLKRISIECIKANLNHELSSLGLNHSHALDALLNNAYIEHEGEIPWLIENAAHCPSATNLFSKQAVSFDDPVQDLPEWIKNSGLNNDNVSWINAAICGKDSKRAGISRLFCECLHLASTTLAKNNLLLSKAGSDYQQKIFKINYEDRFLKLCANYLDSQFSLVPLSDKSAGFLKYGLRHLTLSGASLDSGIIEHCNSYTEGNDYDFFQKLVNLCYCDNLKKNQEQFIREIFKRAALSFPGWAGAYSQKGQLCQFVSLLMIFKSIYGFTFRKEHHPKPCLISIVSRLMHIILADTTTINAKLPELIRLLYQLEDKLRLRIFHKSYEDTIHQSFIEVLASDREIPAALERQYNFVFCIDEREESIRRYVESESRDARTYGYAGFFGIDAVLKQDGREVSICPPLVKPSKCIKINQLEHTSQIQKLSEYLMLLLVNLRMNPFSSALLCLFSPIAVFYQLVTSNFKYRANTATNNLLPEIDFLKTSDNPSGFTYGDIAARVISLLKTTGLINYPGKYVILVGHGGYSTNNPYRSAYDCGACGGKPGDLNARLFASMANLVEVRSEIKRQGYSFPDDCVFVGAYHNTTTDEITVFEAEAEGRIIPDTKQLAEIQHILQEASAKNAKERSRRFQNLPAVEAPNFLREIKKRAFYLSEPRPEYGHATNAFCFVGRREITKELFLDRRAFLVSYQRETDQQGEILKGILKAIIPICMGINLEYFFSAIDNYAYGAGSKLPQNVVAGVAIMTGSLGDIKTGLPKQMVEIHEPIRLAMFVEAKKEVIDQILEAEKALKNPIVNGWLRLFLVNLEGGSLKVTSYREEDNLILKNAATCPAGNLLNKNELGQILKTDQHLPFIYVH